MKRLGLVLAVAAIYAPAFAFDDGRFNNVDPATRRWFESVRSPNGIPCCSVADGHRTTWRADPKTGSYEVPIEGEWIPVPEEAIVRDAGNPTGEAIVWYVRNGAAPHIRCFVPGGGV